MAHGRGWNSSGSEEHALAFVGLQQRRIALLGKLQQFRDQGETMCEMASMLKFLNRKREASRYYQAARDVGAAHGFISVECFACQGLGTPSTLYLQP